MPDAEAPADGRATPRILARLLVAGAAGALAATVIVLAFGGFVAFEQHRWSFGYAGMRFAQVLGAALAWALVVDVPVSLLRERLGWHRYLCLVLEALLVAPVAAAVLAIAGRFSGEALAFAAVLGVLPVLVLAGASLLVARRLLAGRRAAQAR